jgi:predicted permease
MGTLAQDLRFAIRTLSKSPLFVAVAVLSLALGIGANTAIFTLIDQVLLRYLPVKNPEQLVLLRGRGNHYGSNNGIYKISYPMYADFRDNNQVFDGMFCRWATGMSLSFGGKTEHVSGELVSGTYYDVLGISPALGRVFSPEDDKTPDGHPYAVLSYRYWKTRFAGDPNVIGQKLIVNGYPITVVGVSQAGFEGTDPGYTTDVRIPIMMKKALDQLNFYSLQNRRGRWVNAYGRMKPGVSMEQAKAGLQPFFHQMLEMEVKDQAFSRAAPDTKEKFLKMFIDLLPASKGQTGLQRQYSTPLLVLMSIVGLVLLIACANVANLLIARATARQKEIAVRLALGASRGRIVSQLLVESLLLAITGGLVGLGLAIWIDGALLNFLPTGGDSLAISTSPDARILLFNLGVSLLTGIIFGLVPALQAARPNLAPTLKDQGGSITSTASIFARKALVAAQVALSLLLLIGAGLFIRSLNNLKDLDPGFKTKNLLTFALNPPLNGYKPERTREFYRKLLDDLRALPGVEFASLAIMPVLEGDEWDSSVSVEGYAVKTGEWIGPHMNFISPDYFKAMDVKLLAGRDFRPSDVVGAPKVAIVNEKFAKKYFANGLAVGRRVGMGGDPGTKLDIEVIGIAADTKYESMRDEIPIEMYQPSAQMDFVLGTWAYLRTARDPEQTFSGIRNVVKALDPDLPISQLKTVEKQLENSLATERLVASLSSAFGFVATLLAAIGLYGVMAYTVAQRTREIGIRMALGAQTGNVVWLVMRDVLLVVAIGVAIALPAAYGLSRYVKAQLYGIPPNDPWSMALATIVIVSVALAAGYVPARRATTVDPIRALRWE